MPAALDIDRDAVKAHAITHGVRAAAMAFGLPVSTVGSWSERDPAGPWAPKKLIIIDNRPATVKPIANTANKPSVAARNSLADIGNKSRLNLARAVRKGSIAAARMDGKEIIKNATQIKAVADTGDRVFGWSSAAQSPTLRLELIAGAVGMLSQEELPAIDVDMEVKPSPSNDGTSSNP